MADPRATPLPEDLWTVDRAAQFFGLSTSWVYKRVADGTLPVIRFGAAVRFEPEELRAFVRSQKQSSAVVVHLEDRRR